VIRFSDDAYIEGQFTSLQLDDCVNTLAPLTALRLTVKGPSSIYIGPRCATIFVTGVTEDGPSVRVVETMPDAKDESEEETCEATETRTPPRASNRDTISVRVTTIDDGPSKRKLSQLMAPMPLALSGAPLDQEGSAQQ
jgi:hypothetical protein